MARKVIIDSDPGIDDAVALCLALFDSRLEVIAVTGVEGIPKAEQCNRNVQAIVSQLDPPHLPRLGAATALETPPHVEIRFLHGQDSLGNSGFAVSQLHHQHLSDKVICDLVRSSPDEITIVCLGPLTNIDRALRRDPQIADMINRVVIMGGTIAAPGDVTAAAEFNVYYDVLAARSVFQSGVAKTLVPLDITAQVSFTMDLLEALPRETTPAGNLLRRTLPYMFRSYHQELGQESICLPGVITLLSAVQPELFETVEMAGNVETNGELTTGMTVFDRRRNQKWHNNMEVAVSVDETACRYCVVRGIRNSVPNR